MATGDTQDFIARLRAFLPGSWFPQGPLSQNPYPVLAGILAGAANAFAAIYSLITYGKAQTRVATASDAFLDLAGLDYLGGRMPRRTGESDASFRERITDEVVRIRNTRQSITTALTQLTGRPPIVYEPWNGDDSGFLNLTLYLGGGPAPGVGFIGSTGLPFAIFVQAFRPIAFTIPDSEIYAMVNAVRTGGVTAWVNIQN